MSKKKVLVCGATGFIGRNLIEYFTSNRDDFELYGTFFNSKPLNNNKINMIYADLTKKEEVNSVIRGKDTVIQMAAITSGVGDMFSKPHIHIRDNAVMHSIILGAVYEYGISNFIFPSCSIMYKSSETPVKEEDFNPLEEIHSKYFGPAWTKIYLEKMCKFYSEINGTKTKFTVMRHSNIYGPYDKFDLEKSHVFGATMNKVMTSKNGKVIVWGTGEEERDLLYVSDISNFIGLAIDKQTTPFELVNVGYGSSISVANLVKKIIKISKKDLIVEYNTSAPTIKTKVCLDSSKARELFGWQPKISLEEGIKKTIEWYQKNLV